MSNIEFWDQLRRATYQVLPQDRAGRVFAGLERQILALKAYYGGLGLELSLDQSFDKLIDILDFYVVTNGYVRVV